MDKNIENELFKKNGTEKELYHQRTIELIREKYSASDENAILRKKIAGLDTGEFDIYNSYVEECKVKAKE